MVTDRYIKECYRPGYRLESGNKESLGSPGHHGFTNGNKNKENGRIFPGGSHALVVGGRYECESFLK